MREYKAKKVIDQVVVRFAGDSGDGMQLAGDRFTTSSAILGNDIATFPNYPAEIRAPAGTVAGVSSFQVHISDHDVLTPGDSPDVLVAMNPAALKSNLSDLASGAIILLNSDAFDERSLKKAGYDTDPRTNGELSDFKVYEIPMTSLTIKACEGMGAKPRDAERSKNFFALGLLSWMYNRPEEITLRWIKEKYAGKEAIIAANTEAFKAGHAFGETAELFEFNYEVPRADLSKGKYVNITGNQALAWGLVAAGELSGMNIFLGSYPITPASDILHELAKLSNYGVLTFQAEDEIAGIGAALGASYGGALGVTTTSGPGMDLKEETIGLAVSLELPLVIIDVQRGSPSTGLPTKTEQADLLMAFYGRHGEAQVPILAPRTSYECFYAAIEAARIAITYRTPVIVLSDAYLANGAEPWKLPNVNSLKRIDPNFSTEPNHTKDTGESAFWPYLRDPNTLARAWALPGTPKLAHRIGGLEKKDGSGDVSYDPDNHDLMVRIRAQKVANIADVLPEAELDDRVSSSDVLLVGWGSTQGVIQSACRKLREGGHDVAHLQLFYLNPFQKNLATILKGFKTIVVVENNLGQLDKLLRAKYLIDCKSVNKVAGVPFKSVEIEEAVLKLIAEPPEEY